MSGSELEAQIERSRRRLARLRDREGGRGPGEGALAEVVEELGQALEELSITAEELSSTNEELAEAQLAAEQHARRYQELFRLAPDAYIVTDERGVIRVLNEMGEIKLGRTTRYLTGKPLLSLVAESDRDDFLTCLIGLRERRGRLENRMLTFRGSPGFAVSVSAVPEERPEGLEILWILRDVTLLRRAEEALRANEARLRAVLDAALDGILGVDAKGTIRLANRAVCAMFGYDVDELVGREVGVLFRMPPAERASPLLPAGAVSVRQGLRRDGSTFPAQLSVGEAPTEEGVISVATVRDLAPQRELESKLRRAAAAAAVAEDRERRRLAGDLHDDVGQLLTLAGMKLGLLRRGAADPALEARVREVEELVTRVHQRTESLTFQLSPPVLHDMGLAAAAEWLAEEMERSYALRVFVEHAGEPPLDEAARITLFRALRELLINVARHAGTHEARVSLTREDDALTVTVVDGGVGFEPTRRGAGFGLVSLRERVQGLGGTFGIDSGTGQGTRARMTVPLTSALPDPPPRDP